MLSPLAICFSYLWKNYLRELFVIHNQPKSGEATKLQEHKQEKYGKINHLTFLPIICGWFTAVYLHVAL